MYGWEGLDHRVGRLSESLRIIQSLWTEDRTTFNGRYYRLQDAIANPKPIQRPGPPVWIGAGGDQMLRLVARHADVWHPSDEVRDRTQEFSEKLARACEAIGRDPATIRHASRVRFGDGGIEQLFDDLGTAIEQGCTEHPIPLPDRDGPRSAAAIAEVLPRLRALAL